MKFFLLLIFAGTYTVAVCQELGFTTGISKEGIDAQKFQPLYGFTLGKKLNRFFALEAYCIYSQRTIKAEVQADYVSFILMPKVGYFTKRAGIYYAPALALNPTLHHSNIENHTYLSAIQAAGLQVNITSTILIDAKCGYDSGLTKAYLTANGYQKYKGIIMLASVKFDLKCR